MRAPGPARPTGRASAAAKKIQSSSFCLPDFSKRRVAGLARADTHRMLEIEDEHLAIADRARARGPRDGFQYLLDERVRHSRFDLRLRNEVDRVLGPAVELGMPLLSAEALDLGHRHALHTRLGQRLADIFELERLDDSRYEFHRQYLDVVFMLRSLANAEVLLDAEDERRVAAGFAVVKVAHDEVGAVDVGDREIYALVFDGIGISDLE